MIARIALAGLIGLVGAGIVHIVAVLATPRFSDSNAFSRHAGEPGRFAPVPTRDPLARAIACRLDLREPVRLVADGDVPFWSASLLVPDGTNVYSLNDRTAENGALDLIVVRRSEVDALRERLVDDPPEIVALEADGALAVLRVLVPDKSYEGVAGAFIESAGCEPLFGARGSPGDGSGDGAASL